MDIEALEKLNELKEKGVITPEEFENKKAEILNAAANPQSDKSLWSYFLECMTTKYCKFNGRARRREFWGFILFYSLISIFLGFIIGFFGGLHGKDIVSAAGKLQAIISLVFLSPLMGLYVRRFNDISLYVNSCASKLVNKVEVIGKTFIFLSCIMAIHTYLFYISISILLIALFIPFIAFGIMIAFKKSDLVENKYGSVPEGVK